MDKEAKQYTIGGPPAQSEPREGGDARTDKALGGGPPADGTRGKGMGVGGVEMYVCMYVYGFAYTYIANYVS